MEKATVRWDILKIVSGIDNIGRTKSYTSIPEVPTEKIASSRSRTALDAYFLLRKKKTKGFPSRDQSCDQPEDQFARG
jgi:hypothetical protein